MSCLRRIAVPLLVVMTGTLGSVDVGAQAVDREATRFEGAAGSARPRPLVVPSEALVFGVALTAAFLVDEELRLEFGDPAYRPFLYETADALGNAGIMLPILGAGYLLGRSRGNEELSHVFLNAIFSGLLAGSAAQVLKQVIGRVRPDMTANSSEFDPFEGNTAFPSGHASYSAAVLTSLVMDSPSRGLRYAAYGGIAASALARLHYNRHWTSDVVAGAALGIVSARLVARIRTTDTRIEAAPDGVTVRVFF